MKDKLFLPLFLRTVARFLLFWLIVMGVLTLRNLDTQERLLNSGLSESEDWNLRDCQLVLEGDYDSAIKPAQLEDRLSAYYSMYGAMGVYRLYDVDGQELARSQLTSGFFCLPGTGTYSYHLRFDPVLTEEEHLALALRLREERQLLQFYGTEGGLYEEYLGSDQGINFSVGLRGEVTGVVEGNVVYPQKLVYYYEDGPVVLLDTDSDFFDGKELTTLTFDAARISSPLIWSDTSPELALELFREAEARIDSLTADQPPSSNQASTLSGRSGYAHVGPSATLNGIIAASGVAYRPARMALHGLEAVYVGTLLLALLLAFYTTRSQARSLRRERELTNAVAHELKTPLALLRSYAEGLQEDIAPEKREEYLAVIMEESDRMAALVNSLLDFSRMASGKMALRAEAVDLSGLVGEVCRPLDRPAAEKGVRLALETPPCTVSGDRERLRALCAELCGNALRHCRPGGAVRVSLARKGDRVRLRVGNDGDPIPPDALERVFDPLYRVDEARDRAQGGSGLGLALVRETARLHGGTCGAENGPSGPVFWVELPLYNSGASVV